MNSIDHKRNLREIDKMGMKVFSNQMGVPVQQSVVGGVRYLRVVGVFDQALAHR